MQTNSCDLCSKEITSLDHKYFVQIGEQSKIPMMGNSRKAEICYECAKKIEKFITDLKGGK